MHETIKQEDLVKGTLVKGSVEVSDEEGGKSLTITDDVVAMIKEVWIKLSKIMVYQESMREKLKAYVFPRSSKDSREVGVSKELYDGLIKSANEEKLYGMSYMQSSIFLDYHNV